MNTPTDNTELEKQVQEFIDDNVSYDENGNLYIDEMDSRKLADGHYEQYNAVEEFTTNLTSFIDTVCREARIDELEWVKSRSAKHAGIWIDTKGNELDERLTQLNPNKDTV